MKNERLLKVFGLIDEQYIEEGAPTMQVSGASPKISKSFLIKKGALVACAAVAVFIGIYFLWDSIYSPFRDSAPDVSDFSADLPLLASRFESDGMGFEGLMLYDISESDCANPWTEDAELGTLPVYRNLAYSDGTGVPIYLSEAEMLTLAKQTAVALNTSLDGFVSDRMDETAEPYSLTASTHLGEIIISGNGEIAIFFSDPISLPAEYTFTDANTLDESFETLEYLTKQYASLHDFSRPVYNSEVDYTFSGNPHRYYRVFEGAGNMEEQILHYNFDSFSFSSDGEGRLWIIRLGNPLDSAEKIGDYPLITADAAQKLLLAGDYITSVPDEYLKDGKIQKRYIAKVELVYRTGNTNEAFLPYYRFYVELAEFDSPMADGLKNYGAYYVPAIHSEYLSDYPVWDGSFN